MQVQALYEDRYGILSLVSARSLEIPLEAQNPLENLYPEEEMGTVPLKQWYHPP